MKYGQDFLTIEALSQWQRDTLLSSIFIARSDPLPDIRRLTALLWKEKVQSGQKAKTEITGVLQQTLRALKLFGKPVPVASADRCLAELISAGDFTQEVFDRVEPFPRLRVSSSLRLLHFSALLMTTWRLRLYRLPPPQRRHLLKARMQEALANVKLLASFRSHIKVVVVSCCVRRPPEPRPKLLLKRSWRWSPTRLPSPMLARKRKLSGSLVYVEGLRMMYGGGHLLLKDATVELRKGRRYGVVGRNGAGKTTLMDSTASGGISKIPADVKTLHVVRWRCPTRGPMKHCRARCRRLVFSSRDATQVSE